MALCVTIQDLTSKFNIADYEDYTEQHFPEFYAQKPNRKYDATSWWAIYAKPPRIKALKAAIKLCNQ